MYLACITTLKEDPNLLLEKNKLINYTYQLLGHRNSIFNILSINKKAVTHGPTSLILSLLEEDPFSPSLIGVKFDLRVST